MSGTEALLTVDKISATTAEQKSNNLMCDADTKGSSGTMTQISQCLQIVSNVELKISNVERVEKTNTHTLAMHGYLT